MELEEVNIFLDSLAREASRQEPLLVTPNLRDCPLMTHCEECPRKFCSPINHRRHFQTHHRRNGKFSKLFLESVEDRASLGTFWDKLSVEAAKEIMSFNDVMLQEIPGSSVIEILTSSLHGNAIFALPEVYVNAGSILLDVVQAKPGRLPITSRELFSVLDDASERTFFYDGSDESMQKYVFDGETSINSLELKNIIASTSFLFEQKLVKAWVAHKEAEALRWEKLLLEEEEKEAAQKSLLSTFTKQADLPGKKKRKKRRQKEQTNEDNVDLNNKTDPPPLAEGYVVPSTSDSNLNSLYVPENIDSFAEQVQLESQQDNQGESGIVEPQIMCTDSLSQLNIDSSLSKSKRKSRHRKPKGQNRETSKPESQNRETSKPESQNRETFKPEPKKFKGNGNTESLKPPAFQVETSKQELKERLSGDNVDLDTNIDAVDPPPLAEGCAVPSTSDSNLSSLHAPENLDSLSEPLQLESERDIEAKLDLSNQGESGTIEPEIMRKDSLRQFLNGLTWRSKKKRSSCQCRTFKPEDENRQTSKPEGQNCQPFKPKGQNCETFKPEPEDRTLQNGSRSLAKILKINCNTESLKPPPALQVEEISKQIAEENKSECMIDSVPFKLQKSVSQEQDFLPDRNTFKKKNTSEKPVSHGETETLFPVNEDSEGAAAVVERVSDRVISSEECTESGWTDNDCGENIPGGSLPFFNTAAAKEFLAKRWNEVLLGEYVELAISYEDEDEDDLCESSSSVLGNAENQVGTSARKVTINSN